MISLRAALRALSIAGLLLACACASSQPPATSRPHPVSAGASPSSEVQGAQSSSEFATVYIYRAKASFGIFLRPTVMLDGKDLVNVGNGRVFKALFPPAKHVFRMDDGQSGAELDLKPGQTYYMRVDLVPGFWKGGGRLSLVVAEQGGLEIQELRLVEAKEIEDPAFR